MRQFLRIIAILPWDVDAADYYADIRHQLVATGQPIGEMDMMIAAHSLSASAVLVTNIPATSSGSKPPDPGQLDLTEKE